MNPKQSKLRENQAQMHPTWNVENKTYRKIFEKVRKIKFFTGHIWTKVLSFKKILTICFCVRHLNQQSGKKSILALEKDVQNMK